MIRPKINLTCSGNKVKVFSRIYNTSFLLQTPACEYTVEKIRAVG